MCGIAGIFDLKGERPIDRAALRRMTDAVAHRGPDGEGFFEAPGIGFGHRRLAIIDVAGGAQPFHAQNGRGVIAFNGEIYNFQDLARTQRESGVCHATRSDVEVLTEGLARRGPDFISSLRGMFAFGYWNAAEKSLLIARDRMGERPLYYATTPDGFLLFASEIGAIAASGLIALDLDPQAVSDYFLYGFVPDPKSIYKGVRKLPPGTMLRAECGEALKETVYWRPTFAPASGSFAAACDELLSLLDDAVRSQMISDVPLGAFLSGGVDSSAVVSAMAKAGGTVKTCTVGFNEDAFDERPFAREVSKIFSTDHHEDVASIDAASLIDRIAHVYGEPFADASALPTYLVSGLARKHVTVALSGDGGDEIFAGYRRYPFFVNEERVRALAPLSLRKAAFGTAGAVYPKLDWAPRRMRLKTTLQSLGKSRARAYAHAIAANLPDRIGKILSQDFARSLGGYEPESVVEAAMTDDHPLIAAQRADLATWLPGRMLVKVDRAAMAHALEVRPPLLDHRIVEWAGRLDPAFKLDGGEGKRVLKAALEQRLPRDILYRKKQGFALPIAGWLRAKGPLDRLTSSDAWRTSGVLDAKSVETMADQHRRGLADCSQELWTVVMFDAFLRTRIS